MTTSNIPNLAVATAPLSDSKSAKKKVKANAVAATGAPAPAAVASSSSPTTEKPASVATDALQDDFSDNPYIRDLQKTLRNLNKRLGNAIKTDALIEKHKDKSLDELVEAKIINSDQRAQHLNKPTLQEKIAHLEEQLAQHKKIEQDHRTKLATEKVEIEKKLVAKFAKEKDDAIAEIEERAKLDTRQQIHDSLLILSQFLRLAAARRAEENPDLDENLALEGVLLKVYSGDENAVMTMLKLVEGSDDKTCTVQGRSLETSYADVKAVAINNAPPPFPPMSATQESDVNGVSDSPDARNTDVAAAAADVTQESTGATANGHSSETAAADLGEEANASTADQAPPETPDDMTGSPEWVHLENPIKSVDEVTGSNDMNGYDAAPTTDLTSTVAGRSWADDHPEGTPATSTGPGESNDGFHQVAFSRGRGGRGGRGGGGGEGRGRSGWHRRPRGNRDGPRDSYHGGNRDGHRDSYHGGQRDGPREGGYYRNRDGRGPRGPRRGGNGSGGNGSGGASPPDPASEW